MRKRRIDRFLLWKIKPEAEDQRQQQIIRFLEQAAHYFDLPLCAHLVLPKAMSFKDALIYLGSLVGIKAEKPKEHMLPLVARDCQSDDAVLLLPRENKYLVMNDRREIMAKSDVPKRFDEILTLRPFTKPYTSIENLLQKLRSMVPLKFALFLAFIVAAFLIAFVVLCFSLESEVGRMNSLVIVISAFLLAVGIVILAKKIDGVVIKNHDLCSLWLFDNVYRRFLKLPAEQLANISLHELELVSARINRGLGHWFFYMPRLILALPLVLFCAIFFFYQSVWLGMAIVAAGFGIACFLFIANQSERLHQEKFYAARDQLLHILDLYENSRSMIFGLNLGEKFTRHIASAYSKAAILHDTPTKEAAYFMVPCGLFSVAVYLMNFSESLWFLPQSAATLLVLVLVFAYALLSLLEHLNFGFDKNVIAHINSWPKESARAHVEPFNMHGEIELLSINFSYEESGQSILRDFSIKVSAQELVLITGPASSGKTTLLKILASVCQPYKGEVLFDGQDARALNLISLRRYFGVVFENSDIFIGSIYNNIMCARPVKSKALEHLLLSHEVFDSLLDLPMALETYIVERGKNISRLERTAILLARALVHEPKFLFLDEIFAGLCLKDQTVVADFVNNLPITRIVTTEVKLPLLTAHQTVVLPL